MTQTNQNQSTTFRFKEYIRQARLSHEALKALDDIPNYHKADGEANCSNCVLFQAGNCVKYKAKVKPSYVCDEWKGETVKKEASPTPSTVMAHGTGGLFSDPALETPKKKKKRVVSTKEASLTPPESAKNAAKRALEWRDKYGNQVKAMTPVGWTRARQLASGKPLSMDTVKRMAQFNRHRKNADVNPKYKNEPWRDNGYVAWLGWGGTGGIDWAIAQVNKANGKQETTKELATTYKHPGHPNQKVHGYRFGKTPSLDKAREYRKVDLGDGKGTLLQDYLRRARERQGGEPVKERNAARSQRAKEDFKNGETKIATNRNGQTVYDTAKAKIIGNYAVHNNGYRNEITETSTGLNLTGGFKTQKGAMKVARYVYERYGNPPFSKGEQAVSEWGRKVMRDVNGRFFDGNRYPFDYYSGRGIDNQGRDVTTKETKPMKKEADGFHPATHYLVVGDPKQVSTWHLQVYDKEGKLDRRLMGAAKAASTVGYRGNKYQGPDKQKALEKLTKLYKSLDVDMPMTENKAITTKPGHNHGRSIKNPLVYEALLKKGMSKRMAAAISNAQAQGSVAKKEIVTVTTEKHAGHGNQKVHGFRYNVAPSLAKAREYRKEGILQNYLKQARSDLQNPTTGKRGKVTTPEEAKKLVYGLEREKMRVNKKRMDYVVDKEVNRGERINRETNKYYKSLLKKKNDLQSRIDKILDRFDDQARDYIEEGAIEALRDFRRNIEPRYKATNLSVASQPTKPIPTATPTQGASNPLHIAVGNSLGQFGITSTLDAYGAGPEPHGSAWKAPVASLPAIQAALTKAGYKQSGGKFRKNTVLIDTGKDAKNLYLYITDDNGVAKRGKELLAAVTVKNPGHASQLTHGFRLGKTPSLAKAREYRKAGVLQDYLSRAREPLQNPTTGKPGKITSKEEAKKLVYGIEMAIRKTHEDRLNYLRTSNRMDRNKNKKYRDFLSKAKKLEKQRDSILDKFDYGDDRDYIEQGLVEASGDSKKGLPPRYKEVG